MLFRMRALACPVVLFCVGFLGCKDHALSDMPPIESPPHRLPADSPTKAAPDGRFPSGQVLVPVYPSIKNPNGCADGQREGFVDVERFPQIAGCSGAFAVPGILPFNPGLAPACSDVRTHDTQKRSCGGTGDDNPNPSGVGCTVADLCAEGWHVCKSVSEVAEFAPTGCAAATRPDDPPLFFVIRQSSTGCGICASGKSTGPQCQANTCAGGCEQSDAISNDIFGCGNFGLPISNAACGPLNRFSNDKCVGLAGSPWNCDLPGSEDDTGVCEAYTVTKKSPSHGGVLCCAGPA